MINGYIVFDSTYPCKYKQSTPDNINWSGEEPSNKKANVGTSLSGFFNKGKFEIPADSENGKSGLFDFGHAKPLTVLDMILESLASMSWTLSVVPDVGTPVVIQSGSGLAVVRLDKEIILQPGEKLKIDSTGSVTGSSTACFTVAVKEGV